MATETELKLATSTPDFDWIDELPVVREHAEAPAAEQELVTVYHDTPNLDLRHRRISIRLRDIGDRWLQTVKAGGGAEVGLHARKEWEIEVPSQRLELERIASGRVRKLLFGSEIADHLGPIFTTRFRRRAWDLRFADGTRIELAADRGAVTAGDASAPISEIELELKRGHVRRLYEVGLALNDAQPLRLSGVSKAERGYDLLAPRDAPVGVCANDAGLESTMSLEDAFVTIVRSGMTQVHANEPVLFDNPEDVEGVHQMRVATRRLRSCFVFFRRWIPKTATAALAEELKWLTNRLGPARDWDVFLLESVGPLVEVCPDDASLRGLQREAGAIRGRAYETARDAVGSARYTALLLRLAAWIEDRTWREDEGSDLASLDRPVKPTVRKRLLRREKRIRRSGRNLAAMSGEERHRFRIAMKKHRYACKFFAELLGKKKKARAYFSAMSKLQDSLGILNDLHVIEARLAALGERVDPTALALVKGSALRSRIDEQQRLQEHWRAFSDARWL